MVGPISGDYQAFQMCVIYEAPFEIDMEIAASNK